jgi:hypothetical protein
MLAQKAMDSASKLNYATWQGFCQIKMALIIDISVGAHGALESAYGESVLYDKTQTTKSPRADEPDADSVVKVGQPNAPKGVACR